MAKRKMHSIADKPILVNVPRGAAGRELLGRCEKLKAEIELLGGKPILPELHLDELVLYNNALRDQRDKLQDEMRNPCWYKLRVFPAKWTELLGKAIKACPLKDYTAKFVGADLTLVMSVVNKGIDAHLEACYVHDRGDRFQLEGGELNMTLSKESLRVLIRRLFEKETDASVSLACTILETLQIKTTYEVS